MYLIEFKDVVKKFGKNAVIDKLSLSIKKGEVFGIIGRSGSGKSTLLKVLLGAYKIDEGKIIYSGKEITNKSHKISRIVGITTQENSFYEHLSLEENMNYYSKLYGVSGAEIYEILKSVDLLEHKDKLAKDISGGMKRRLDFAISLVHNPEILILDEPTTGLDPLLVKQFWQVVNKFVKEKGKTIIVISHIFSELIDNCSRVGVLDKGKITGIIQIPKSKSLNLYKKFVEAIR